MQIAINIYIYLFVRLYHSACKQISFVFLYCSSYTYTRYILITAYLNGQNEAIIGHWNNNNSIYSRQQYVGRLQQKQSSSEFILRLSILRMTCRSQKYCAKSMRGKISFRPHSQPTKQRIYFLIAIFRKCVTVSLFCTRFSAWKRDITNYKITSFNYNFE